MMKKFTLLMMLLSGIMGYSQNAPIDFEAGGYGANWTWTVFENLTNPALEIVANPDQTGANTSATVAKFTALQGGQPWAGCESLHGSDIGSFSFDETNTTVKIMVWKSVISDVGLKFVEASGEAQPEVKVANTLINQWEELTFDLSGSIGMGITGIIDQIVVFPDFDLNGRTQDNIIYFDNITFSEQGGGSAGPLEAAPDPTEDPQKVISMFSGVYTDVPVDTWRTDWSDGNLQDIEIDGNPTKKYTSLNFVGIETVGANIIDATSMTHFHLDVWTPDANDFKVKLVDFGADAAYGGGDDSEHELTFSTPATETWISYDIPLSDFTGLLHRDHIAQLILVKAPQGTIYVDNVYYYDNIVATEDISSNKAYKVYDNQPNPFSQTTLIKYAIPQSEKVEISVYDISGRKVSSLLNSEKSAGTHQIEWDASNQNSGIYFIEIKVGGFVDVKKCVLQ